MKDIELRTAVRRDYPQIVDLVSSREELFLVFPSGRWPLDLRQLERLAEHRLDLTVCVVEDTVIGFANLYDKQPRAWAFVGNVVVHRDFRGRGIGRQLVRYMLDLVFGEHDLPEARISVFSDNIPALKLYQGLGFSQFATETRTRPSGRPATLLHLRLTRPGDS